MTGAENLVISRADVGFVIDWRAETRALEALLDRMPFRVRLDSRWRRSPPARSRSSRFSNCSISTSACSFLMNRQRDRTAPRPQGRCRRLADMNTDQMARLMICDTQVRKTRRSANRPHDETVLELAALYADDDDGLQHFKASTSRSKQRRSSASPACPGTASPNSWKSSVASGHSGTDAS